MNYPKILNFSGRALLLASGNPLNLCQRHVGSLIRVKPLRVATRKRKEVDDPGFRKIQDPAVKQEFQNVENDLEPNMENVDLLYGEYYRDKHRQKTASRRHKVKRYFMREFMYQEISFLSYAEKENIRYLHENNPEYWTPEQIAESFPISEQGAQRLLKNKIRIRSKERVVAHDEKVLRRIEQIKTGGISVDPETRKKLAIREKIPFQVGTLPINADDIGLVDKPRPLGEFESIVASPRRVREAEEANRKLQEEIKEERIDTSFVEQLKRLKIRTNQQITLDEFENRLKSSEGKSSLTTEGNKTWLQSNSEAQTLLRMSSKQEDIPKSVEQKNFEPIESKATDVEFFLGKKPLPKWNKAVKSSGQISSHAGETGQANSLQFDQTSGQAFVYDQQVGYQTPFHDDESSPDTINIPRDKRVAGAIYKRGNSYYDENGEFMYRVV